MTSLAGPMSQATLARNIRICADMRTWHDCVSDSLGVKERVLQELVLADYRPPWLSCAAGRPKHPEKLRKHEMHSLVCY